MKLIFDVEEKKGVIRIAKNIKQDGKNAFYNAILMEKFEVSFSSLDMDYGRVTINTDFIKSVYDKGSRKKIYLVDKEGNLIDKQMKNNLIELMLKCGFREDIEEVQNQGSTEFPFEMNDDPFERFL